MKIKFVYDDRGNLIKITGVAKPTQLVQKWTSDLIENFRNWHESSMEEHNYDHDVQQELRSSREHFLVMVTP